MSDLKIGDVVELKSGSAPMTIVDISHTDQGEKTRCAWQHHVSKEILHEYFPSESLEKPKSKT